MPKLKPITSAILKWPQGLDSSPIIYPVGDSEETNNKIVALLEKYLRGKSDE